MIQKDRRLCILARDLAWAAPLLLVVFPASLTADDDPNRLAFIGLHGGVFEQLQGHAKDQALRLDYLSDDRIARREVDLSGYRLVFLEHLRAEDRDVYRDLFVSARKVNPGLRIFAIGPENALTMFTDLGDSNPVERDPEMVAYYPRSRDNLRRFLLYVSVKYLGRPGKIEPPAEVESSGLYHPDHDGLFDSASAFLEWSATKGKDVRTLPRAAVTVHGSHLLFQQPRVVDAIVREFESKGVLACGIVDLVPRYEMQIEEFGPDVVIHTCHTRESIELRKNIGVPHIHSLFFRKQSIEQWRTSGEGLAPSEAAFQILSQEPLGAIEPQVGAGTIHGLGGDEAFSPVPDRVEHLVNRAIAWIRLRKTPRAEKRVAVIYYDREMGRSELMRGSATGMFLNGPRSLVKVLQRMKAEGYALSAVPSDEDELIGWLQSRGRQIGLWDQDALDRLARSGQAVLIPETTYRDWFENRLDEPARAEVVKHWGPVPGNLLVWQDRGERYIVLPRIDLGNVILLPQPLRGEAQDPSVLHSGTAPPPHNYLATYFWLENEFKANALIHFGTHGSEFALPGKTMGLSGRDWPDVLMGSMPNVNPWIIDNPGETAPAKRRAYAVLIGHLTPPIVKAGLADDLLNLQGMIDKWRTLDVGALRETFRKQITDDVDRQGLAREAGVADRTQAPLTDEQVERVAEYLHEIGGESTPVSLHVLGEPPRDDLLIPFLVSILKQRFLDDLGKIVPVPATHDRSPGDRTAYLRKLAEETVSLVVRRGATPAEAIAAAGGSVANGVPEELARALELAVDLNRRFGDTKQEIDNIIGALDGRFVPPGPVNSPIRNPNAVPTGRNLAMLNPDEVPSRPSWEIGKALIDQFLKDSIARTGRYPEKVGFDLNAFATFRDFGVMEGQILHLLGVEPVWDDRDLVREVRLIPADQLNRPRIDVFISVGGYYEINLPGRLELIDKAIRLVADAREPDNAVERNAERVRLTLAASGVAADRAEALAKARIFGRGPGQFSNADYYYLVERSGQWDSREELIERYLAGVKNVFTQGHWGERAPEAYDAAIQGTDTVLRSWSDQMTGPLSNKYTWFTGGSLCLAVKHLTGKEPNFVLSDVRDPDRAGMTRAEDALAREYRSRLFNRKWIEGMMKEGYAGADQVAVMVNNSMGWSIMRPGSVPDSTWEEIDAVFVQDKLGLSIREWFESVNPFAFQDMTETILETIRKGYWKASAETTQRLAAEYAKSVVRHGESGGLRGGGNASLDRFVERALQQSSANGAADLLAAYHAKSRSIPADPPPTGSAAPGPNVTAADPGSSQAEADVLAVDRGTVDVVRLATPAGSTPIGPTAVRTWAGWIVAGLASVMVLGGFLWQRRVG